MDSSIPPAYLFVVATLLPLAATYNPSIDRRSFYPSTPAIEHLQRATADGSRVLMPGHVGLVYGLFEAHGYDGLTPRRIEEVTGPVGTGRAPHAGLLENILALNGSERGGRVSGGEGAPM